MRVVYAAGGDAERILLTRFRRGTGTCPCTQTRMATDEEKPFPAVHFRPSVGNTFVGRSARPLCAKWTPLWRCPIAILRRLCVPDATQRTVEPPREGGDALKLAAYLAGRKRKRSYRTQSRRVTVNERRLFRGPSFRVWCFYRKVLTKIKDNPVWTVTTKVFVFWCQNANSCYLCVTQQFFFATTYMLVNCMETERSAVRLEGVQKISKNRGKDSNQSEHSVRYSV